MNTKSIVCPNCNVQLLIGVNCTHLADLSLICAKCGKIAFPTNDQQETGVTKSVSYTPQGRNCTINYL